jgi:uncharacterized repeat protein (TIGR03843 family)
MTPDDLLSGELRILGRITDASNATLLAEIESATVVYKPIAGERPLWDFPSGNLASREYAAYLVSEELGFNIVPPTVLREGPYGPGMVQLWCEPDEEIDVVQFSQSDNSLIRAMTLFDVVINNGDRKFGHILPISMGELKGCDHGVTFNVENKLRTVLWQVAGSPFNESEKVLLTKATDLFAGALLEELISPEERSASIERIRELIGVGCFPFPSEEWPAIPWPPF